MQRENPLGRRSVRLVTSQIAREPAVHSASPTGENGGRGEEKQSPMNVNNTKSQMRKGMLDYCVLLLLSSRESYTNDIIRRLKDAELIVVEGTLYPLLNRLKKDGLLTYRWEESTQGPPRKYYEITDEGRASLAELDAVWAELAHTVGTLKASVADATPDDEEQPMEND